MKPMKMAGKVSAMVAAAVAAVTMWGGGTAHASTNTWGAIEPVSADSYNLFLGFGPSCLALNGSDGYYNDHTRVIQWQCTGNDDQQWETRWAGTVYVPGTLNQRQVYQIVNKKSGKCMEVRDGMHVVDGGNGYLIDQITCAPLNDTFDFSNQMWEMALSAGGTTREIMPYSSILLGTGECLDVDSGYPYNGTKVQQWACHDGDNQQFIGAPLNDVYS